MFAFMVWSVVLFFSVMKVLTFLKKKKNKGKKEKKEEFCLHIRNIMTFRKATFSY
jgi:hypothetical protein